MAHSTNYISQVKLPGSNTVYDIHDKYALHDPSDLGISGALILQGSAPSLNWLETNAPANASRLGYVYLVGEAGGTGSSTEYVCTTRDGGKTYQWESLGNVHDHIHEVTVTGTNKSSNVTVSGNIGVGSITVETGEVLGGSFVTGVTKETANVLGASTNFTASVTGGSGVGTVTIEDVSATVQRSTNVAVTKETAAAVISVTKQTASFVNGLDSEDATVVTGISSGNSAAVTEVTPTTESVIGSLSTATVNIPTVSGVNITGVNTVTSATASKVSVGTVDFTAVSNVSSATASKVSKTDHTIKGISSNSAVDFKEASFSVSGGVLTIGLSDKTASYIVSAADVSVSQITSLQDVEASVVTTVSKSASTVTAQDVDTMTLTTKTFTASSVTLTPTDVVVGGNNKTVVTGITPTTGNFLTSVSVNSTTKALTKVTPTTATAVTGFTLGTSAFVTGVGVSTQPAFTVTVPSVVTNVQKTALGSTITVGTNDIVAAVTNVGTTASTVSVTAVTGVTPVPGSLTLTGTAEAQVWEMEDGKTGFILPPS